MVVVIVIQIVDFEIFVDVTVSSVGTGDPFGASVIVFVTIVKDCVGSGLLPSSQCVVPDSIRKLKGSAVAEDSESSSEALSKFHQ